MENKPSINYQDIERRMLDHPQVDCPVTHHFGPGIYIREVFLPAGAIVMGHEHKVENLNIILCGSLLLLKDDGDTVVISGPKTFVNGPGRKVAYVLEDTVFQNVFATDETDVEKLEEMFIQKSIIWENAQIKDNGEEPVCLS